MNRAIMIAVAAIIFVGTRPSAVGSQPGSTAAGGRIHTVTVVLKDDDDGGGCTVYSLVPLAKLRVSRKDDVVWHFQNDCKADLSLKVAHFRASKEHRDKVEPREDPLDNRCLRQASAAHGKAGEVKCEIKRDTYAPRSYKYDVIGNDKVNDTVLLDPEIEIRP